MEVLVFLCRWVVCVSGQGSFSNGHPQSQQTAGTHILSLKINGLQ